jgi:arylsulfatase A-like enzyme
MALLVMGAGFASCNNTESVNQSPNVLFIMTDDHTQQALYAYGKGLLDTVLFPNMNRLA